MNYKNSIISVLLLTVFSSQLVQARDFRSIIKIPAAPQNISLSSTTKQKPFRPVDTTVIEKSVRKIVSSWNHYDFSKYLADAFQAKTLLINTIRRSVPRDARLRLLSVQGISTIKQEWTNNSINHRKKLNSVVITTVELQLEFNDPFQGQIKLPHTSQFYLQVTESE